MKLNTKENWEGKPANVTNIAKKVCYSAGFSWKTLGDVKVSLCKNMVARWSNA